MGIKFCHWRYARDDQVTDMHQTVDYSTGPDATQLCKCTYIIPPSGPSFLIS